MADFVFVTRKDNGARQVINLDAVERIDINPPAAAPSLDSNVPITEEHLGGAVIHFMFQERGPTRIGMDSMAVLESVDDILGKPARSMAAADKMADDRARQVEEIQADRQKERDKAAADRVKTVVAEAKIQVEKVKADNQPPKKARKAKKAGKLPKAKKARKGKAAK